MKNNGLIREYLAPGLVELGIRAAPDMIDRLDEYAQRLLEKNQVMNLTAITEPQQIAQLHMLDSAALLPLIRREYVNPDLDVDIDNIDNIDNVNTNAKSDINLKLLDVGTGAGFPGLVLKILAPDLNVTLLDSQRKRLLWLNELITDWKLEGIQTIHARSEEQSRDIQYRERWDIVTARAVAELRVLCELCLPYVKPGGIFLAMKSVDSDAELQNARKAIKILGAKPDRTEDYTIPGTNVRHRVILIRKLTRTPEKYPRMFAKIRKNPL